MAGLLALQGEYRSARSEWELILRTDPEYTEAKQNIENLDRALEGRNK